MTHLTHTLTTLDYGIIIGFFAVILSVGLIMSKAASKNLESYFLGGRNLPWYLLGVTGMSQWFDLAGTMIITSFLFLVGPRGIFIEFRGGAVLVLAFMLAYTGKWHRRSGCMTGAEWNSYRFGTGFSGELMRFMAAFTAIITNIAMIAYLVRGATLFMGIVFPAFDPLWMTVGVLGLASLYTMLSGFYGVVLTDLVQGLIMITACIVISVIAYHIGGDASHLAAVTAQVTENLEWTRSDPAWHVSMPDGYKPYEFLFVIAMFYLLKNVLQGMGTGAEPRFFGARNPRECSLQCLVQGFTVMFRWPLMIGFAVIGIVLVSEILPDKAMRQRGAAIVHEAFPDVQMHNWHGTVETLMRHPEQSPETVQKIEAELGDNWESKMMLVGFNGNIDPERIMPAVLMNKISPGFRGLIVVALLAAMMGALTAMVNMASAFLVRDIYQNFIRKKAGNRELMAAAYLSTAGTVVLSFALGMYTDNINSLWSWIIMGLTAGTLAPGLLRLYWWRTNAWGMACGLFLGGVGAVVQKFVCTLTGFQLKSLADGVIAPILSVTENLFGAQALNYVNWLSAFANEEIVLFLLMTLLSFVGTIAGSLLTAPIPDRITRHFYRTTRPFGIWGKYKRELDPETRRAWTREHRNDILTVPFAMLGQVVLFMIPMQIITKNFGGLYWTVPLLAVSGVALYFFWWKNLPPADEKTLDSFEETLAVLKQESNATE